MNDFFFTKVENTLDVRATLRNKFASFVRNLFSNCFKNVRLDIPAGADPDIWYL